MEKRKSLFYFMQELPRKKKKPRKISSFHFDRKVSYFLAKETFIKIKIKKLGNTFVDI